jgi:hypothetical protein
MFFMCLLLLQFVAKKRPFSTVFIKMFPVAQFIVIQHFKWRALNIFTIFQVLVYIFHYHIVYSIQYNSVYVHNYFANLLASLTYDFEVPHSNTVQTYRMKRASLHRNTQDNNNNNNKQELTKK